MMKSVILTELRHHGPFTLLGAAASVIFIMALRTFFPEVLSTQRAAELFEFSHPMHVVLSAMVTSALFRNYRSRDKHSKKGLVSIILVGYFGSIGIATLSDCIIPYWGELLLGMNAGGHVHLGIIEMPFAINFAAFLGIGAACIYPKTHFPHTGHVWLSMAASLFHILRVHEGSFSAMESISISLFLFLAVWIPCCLSDIVFPLLFVGKPGAHIGHHSH